MGNIPDLKQLRLPLTAVRPSPLEMLIRRPRQVSRFLRGPIPWVWLRRAAQLPGRALHVAIAIRLWTGIKKTDSIVMPTATLAEMNVSRHAAARAVRALDEAGLLIANRRAGRKTRVRVIEVDEAGDQEASSRNAGGATP